MPYINQDNRRRLIDLKHYADFAPNIWEINNAGELNYMISSLIDIYMSQHGKCYETMNDIIGALEANKLEYYRRVVAPYENTKIVENGDVYDYEKNGNSTNAIIGRSVLADSKTDER